MAPAALALPLIMGAAGAGTAAAVGGAAVGSALGLTGLSTLGAAAIGGMAGMAAGDLAQTIMTPSPKAPALPSQPTGLPQVTTASTDQTVLAGQQAVAMAANAAAAQNSANPNTLMSGGVVPINPVGTNTKLG